VCHAAVRSIEPTTAPAWLSPSDAVDDAREAEVKHAEHQGGGLGAAGKDQQRHGGTGEKAPAITMDHGRSSWGRGEARGKKMDWGKRITGGEV
jgi:hypothetical protein